MPRSDVARDFSVISFAGYVAQSYGEHPAHLNKCVEIIYPQIDKLKELAEVIFKSDVDVPKADVLAVLA